MDDLRLRLEVELEKIEQRARDARERARKLYDVSSVEELRGKADAGDHIAAVLREWRDDALLAAAADPKSFEDSARRFLGALKGAALGATAQEKYSRFAYDEGVRATTWAALFGLAAALRQTDYVRRLRPPTRFLALRVVEEGPRPSWEAGFLIAASTP